MNLPNRLTCLRIVMVPVCLVLTVLSLYPWAAAVFLLASLTDFLDGYIARRYNLVTNFGKFADPIADKLLTLTMMIVLGAQGRMPLYLPVVVAARELTVDGLRLIAMEQGEVVAAGLSGKIKTALQMVAVLCALFLTGAPPAVAAALACALTVYSGAEYLWKLRHLFRNDFKK